MAIATVGSPVFSTGNTSVTTKDINIAPTAGNTVVAWCMTRDAGTTTGSMAATGGTATFTKHIDINPGTGLTHHLWVFVATNVGSGITKITHTISAGAFMFGVAQEFSGVDSATPLDVAVATAITTAVTAISSASVTPVTNGAWVLAASGNNINAATTTPFPAMSAGPTATAGTKAGTGWTALIDRWNQGTAAQSLTIAVGKNEVNDTTGAYRCNWTQRTAREADQGTIVLRPAAAGTAVSAALSGAGTLSASATAVAAANSGFFGLM